MNVLLIMTTMLLSPTSHVVSKPLSYTKWRLMFRKVNDIRYDDNKESIREKDKGGKYPIERETLYIFKADG